MVQILFGALSVLVWCRTVTAKVNSWQEGIKDGMTQWDKGELPWDFLSYSSSAGNSYMTNGGSTGNGYMTNGGQMNALNAYHIHRTDDMAIHQLQVMENGEMQMNPTPLVEVIRKPDFDDVRMGLAGVARFQNAVVASSFSPTGPVPIVYDGSVLYFEGSCDPATHDVFNNFPSSQLAANGLALSEEYDKLVVLAGLYGFSYYHWLIQDLLRVMLVEDVIGDPDVKLLMYEHPNGADNRNVFFKLLGIDPDQFLNVGWPGEAFQAKEVLVPGNVVCMTGNGAAVRKARAKMQQGLEEHASDSLGEEGSVFGPGSSKNLKILVHKRGDGAQRSMTNHQEMMETIREKFPDAVVAEFNDSFDAMATLAAHYEADMIVGPHGAGMSNVIVSRPGSILIEIQPAFGISANNADHRNNNCYLMTAHQLDMKYFKVQSELSGEQSNHWIPFPAPIAKVIETMELALVSRKKSSHLRSNFGDSNSLKVRSS